MTARQLAVIVALARLTDDLTDPEREALGAAEAFLGTVRDGQRIGTRVLANRQDQCARCRLTIRVGDAIKPNMVIRGFDGGKPQWQRGQGYVHAKCPKIDARTGEVQRSG